MATTPAEVHIHNTLSGKREKFVPRHAGEVLVYGCGPTVYGLAHVGNARAALTFDLVNRVMRLAGYKVRFARNVTDIEDKIIRVANERGISWKDVVQEFTKSWHDEMDALNVLPLEHEPRATESIPEMHCMIQGLINKGLAYVAETPFGNDVYYSVGKFEHYGCLSGRKLEDMKAGARVEPGEAKKDPLDFALWKAAKPGEPSWESPWGPGRPGWHIECSAMVQSLFPDGIDIHLGGIDLIFPHHENEIAQSEGLSGKKLSTYWVHNGMLTFNREKMSKSLGNIITTKSFVEQYGGETLRLMCLQHHYKGPMDFSEEAFYRAEALVERLYSCKQQVIDAAGVKESAGLLKLLANFDLKSVQLPPELATLAQQMREALFDDFNAAKAIGFALKAARTCFRDQQKNYWMAFGQALSIFEEGMGLLTLEPAQAIEAQRARRLKRLGVTPERAQEIEKRLADREIARKNKDFAESDRLRQLLETEGVVVMDGADGAAWTLKGPIA